MEQINKMVEDYNIAKEKLKVFDLSCSFPHVGQDTLGDFSSKQKIIEEVRSHGIDKAVFWTYECLETSPILGNEILIKATKDYDFCYIAPVIGPDMSTKPGEIDEFLDYYKKNKMVAVRIFPKTLQHSTKDWMMGDIFRALEKRGIPVMVWHTQISWDEVADIAERYPDLKIIVEAIDKKLLYHARSVVNLIKNYKNIFFTTYNFTQYEIIKAAGTEPRIVFGSNYPVSDPNVSFGLVINAEMTEAEKQYTANGFANEILYKMK